MTEGIWDGVRANLASENADVRFSCTKSLSTCGQRFDVDLAFYDVCTYSCLSTLSHAPSTPPHLSFLCPLLFPSTRLVLCHDVWH